jgi:TPR repeat protein
MVMIATCYFKGCGVEQSEDTAVGWLDKAARSGTCPDAGYELACHLLARLKRDNPQRLQQYYSSGASPGSAPSPVPSSSSSAASPTPGGEGASSPLSPQTDASGRALSLALDDGDVQELQASEDVQRAVKLLLDAAAAGHARAKSRLGEVYEDFGDLQQAARWYQLALGAGCSVGAFRLGKLVLYKYEEFDPDTYSSTTNKKSNSSGRGGGGSPGAEDRVTMDRSAAHALLQAAVRGGEYDALNCLVRLCLCLTQRHFLAYASLSQYLLLYYFLRPAFEGS